MPKGRQSLADHVRETDLFGVKCPIPLPSILSDRLLLSGSSIVGEWGLADTSLTTLSHEMCEQLGEIYLIRTESEVFSFLAGNAELLDVLLEVQERIAPFFEEASLFLEYISGDIETDAGFLLVRIGVKDDPTSARARLHEFGEKWWLNEWVRIDGRITIDIEAQ